MLTIIKHGVVLSKTAHVFENEGVLNPAAIREGDKIHLFYRAVSTGNFSTVGHCILKDPLTIEGRDEEPLIIPQFGYESHGIEDPRIVKIDDLYYMTYTAYDGINALGALATSTDLVHFEHQGLIIPQITYAEFDELANTKGKLNAKYLRYNEHERVFENEGAKALLWDKNLILFPRKIKNQFCFLHRIKPDIQILVAVNSFEELTTEFWRDYFMHFNENVVLTPKYDHEVSYIGGGCPPIETAAGWLLIYHGVHDSLKGYVYSACAALLDLEDPRKEISRLPYPLFVPEYPWELKGEVNNVCFPTGAVTFDDTLYIYYGAADERIACASLKIPELIEELLRYSVAPNVTLEVTPGFE
jgi:predicted GH43/DUF377 family glycosyl hydrolase